MCVPVRFPGRSETAVLYVDDRKTVARFSFTDYSNLLNVARRIGNPAASKKFIQSPKSEKLEIKAAETVKSNEQFKLPIAQQVTFFRSLATFIQAGYSAAPRHSRTGSERRVQSAQRFLRISAPGLSLPSVVSATPPHPQRSTPIYMAPEQLQSSDIDPRADLFSPGLILYERLSPGLPS